ncbi:MAG TPA: menaquinol-cytochrome c reductase cytochrome b subunit [Acidimicrobiales bacterium]|nr:menaquinol-cytochrome c reductase cytochrome b subunit [Acidimicrobiales bacterium]
MTEIPEHLLKRAAERRAALQSKPAEEPEAAAAGGGGAGSAGPAEGAPASEPAPEGAGVATLERASGVATGGRTAAPPVGTAGHTQRLLTVVKAGSIQDVKATPTDKVNVWPHLLVVEFAAALIMTAFLTLFSIFVNAPLLQLANPNLTPNPSKAPWYFLGLQEMLTMFHPMVAGVTIPGIALGVLGAAGYIDKNPSHKPEDRKFAIALFTFFLMFWAVLVLIGSFFRGEGQNFILPWRQGVHDIFDL